VFKMTCAFAALAVVQWLQTASWLSIQLGSRGFGETYFSTSRVPKTTPSSTCSWSGSRDDAQALYFHRNVLEKSYRPIDVANLIRKCIITGVYQNCNVQANVQWWFTLMNNQIKSPNH
jgi:hypothetical protein